MSRLRGSVTVLALLVAVLIAGVGCTPSVAARNARLLGLESLTFESTGADQTRVTWRIPGFDPGVSEVDVSGDGVSPIWLTEPIVVRRAPGVLVFGAGDTALDRVLEDARAARRKVRDFFPGWNGRLVVEVPSSEAALTMALNGQFGDYAGVAAVTSSPDGSRRSDSAIHVFVNQSVYAEMSPSAARIVMTHEVTHVATKAPIVRVPLWWAEGLADYVAFSTADRRDAGAARALIRRSQRKLASYVQAHGVPDGLPQEADFTGDDQDAAYESARLAAETLAETSGTGGSDALAQVQRLLADGVSEQRAISRVFGISHHEFIETWQRRLAGMAEQVG